MWPNPRLRWYVSIVNFRCTVDLAIVIPVLNQAHYTRACLDGLRANHIPDSRIVVVDNASTDETPEFLGTRRELQVIRNETNRGCGGAWNQGVRALTAQWTVILNNDVLLPENWLTGMMNFAETNHVQVVSPASCEGPMDYDFPGYAKKFMEKMARVSRRGIANGACFMVKREVFEAIGLFDDDPRLGGYEDDEFFRRARARQFRIAITGASFLHHYGSVTQKALKADLGLPQISLGDRAYYRQKYGLNWFKRQGSRVRNKVRANFWRWRERALFGCTILSSRREGRFIWR